MNQVQLKKKTKNIKTRSDGLVPTHKKFTRSNLSHLWTPVLQRRGTLFGTTLHLDKDKT